MDSVPYPQPLAGPEPQYVPWGVLLVTPIGQPPRPVPPRAADQRSRAYFILLCVLRWGPYITGVGPKPLRLGPSLAFPVGPSRPAPIFAVWFVVVGFPVSLGWGGGWWWTGGGSSPLLAVLLVCVSPPLLAEARRRWRRVVPHHSWLRVFGVAPRHSWLGSSGVGGGVGLCHSWLRSAGLGGVVPRFRPQSPGWAFSRHS